LLDYLFPQGSEVIKEACVGRRFSQHTFHCATRNPRGALQRADLRDGTAADGDRQLLSGLRSPQYGGRVVS
jgi:hypothetical protein